MEAFSAVKNFHNHFVRGIERNSRGRKRRGISNIEGESIFDDQVPNVGNPLQGGVPQAGWVLWRKRGRALPNGDCRLKEKGSNHWKRAGSGFLSPRLITAWEKRYCRMIDGIPQACRQSFCRNSPPMLSSSSLSSMRSFVANP